MTRRVWVIGQLPAKRPRGIRAAIIRLFRPESKPVVSLEDYRLTRRPKDLDGRPVKGGAA